MALKRICDICESDEPEIESIRVVINAKEGLGPKLVKGDVDLCLTCLGKLQRWLEGDAIISEE